MIIVSDTSPVTSLLSIGRIDLLSSLFGPIIIPSLSEILDELQSEAGFYLADAVKTAAREAAGE